MAEKSSLKLVFKIIESISLIVGPTVFALNFFSFKASKAGFYYEPVSEWGMSIGVLFIMLALVARQWQK